MKKLWILVSLILICVQSPVGRADSFRFVWTEGSTYIEVPLNANIYDYVNKPKAELYRNNILLNDTNIELMPNGDWLYLLTDVDTSKEGDYKVWYKATESVYRPGQCQGYKVLVTFHVVDDEAPVIEECPSELFYVIGTNKPDYLAYVKASDNSGNVDVNYYDNEVNYNKVGNYFVYIYAYDLHKKSEKKILLHVVDNDGPKIKFLGDNNTITVNIGEAINLTQFFQAIDDGDGDVTHTMAYDPIDFSVEGLFERKVKFNDSQGNYSEYKIFINVVDSNELSLELLEENLLLDYLIDFNEYNFNQNISSAYYGNEDISEDVIIDTSKLMNKVGVYEVIYTYEILNKKIKKVCYVHLLSSEAPIINLRNADIEVGESVYFFDYIEVIDESDPDIYNSVQINDSVVDYSNVGVYPVYVSATNSSGLTTTKIMYVNVSKKSLEIDYSMVVVGLVVVYLVGEKIIKAIRRRFD